MMRRPTIGTKLIAAGAVLALAALAGPAHAHGEIQGTDPASDATVPRAPRTVAITFTEAPTARAVLGVRDGCKRNVGQGVDVAGATATVRVATGQPGKWQVSYNVVSALDGHQTQGSYTFTVQGQKDCTPDPATPEPTDPDDGGGEAAPPDDDEPAGSSAPVIPIALGAVAVIALALILRRSGSG